VGQVVGVVGVILLVALAARSDGITWGTIDTTHPNVGGILIVRANGMLGEFCSGTLVSARVFLTAGHCTDALASRAIPASRLRVSFSPNLFAAGAVYLDVSGYHTDPDYRWGPTSDPHDLGVIVLATAVTGVAFGVPAPANYLDGLADAGLLQAARFINVGYGDNQNFTVTGDRQISYSGFRNLHDAWLYMSQNIHLGNGGTCYGDSGGPTFFIDPTSHTEYIVATTSWGDSPCKSTNNNYRVDIPSSLDFIHTMIAENS
jgi:hypothetical protein